ncbi:MAG: RNA methyltransferase [Candidatus Xenobium sp.]|jgi:TrmH family RNA methyltransferase
MNSILSPEDVRVVLVSPEGEANIGAVSRSMVCFGVQELVLVTPYRQPAEEARNWACHGLPVLEGSRIASSLDEALEGVNLVAGLTRRAGKRRHRMLSPVEFKTRILPRSLPCRLALVFGTEESGLSNEELDRCHRLVKIPSRGSLNLAHAVSLMLYELFGRAETISSTRTARLASPELRRKMLDALAGHLQAMGYPFHQASLEEEMTKLSDILERAELEEWETNFLGGMFKHLRIQFERARGPG